MTLLVAFSCFVFAQHNAGNTLAGAAAESDTTSSATALAPSSSSYAKRVARRLDSLCTGDMFFASQLGLMVCDLDDDRVLYMLGERQRLRPASTMKLLTAITALSFLGDDYSFCTALYAAGRCEGNTFVGNLYVKGTMDPTLHAADLDSFADSVLSLHVDTLRGNILADRSFMSGPRYGEGWSWDDENPLLSPLVYEGGDNLISLLHLRLRQRGMVVVGSEGVGTVPMDEATLLAERRTPLRALLPTMLKMSDNQYAESIFYNIGAVRNRPSTVETARGHAAAILRAAGLDPDDYYLADGSGLSPYNYLTAEAEVFLLRYAYRDKRIYTVLRQALPIAGVEGTLQYRMRRTAAKGNVRAKTGTLTGVSALAGYCTSPEGHTIAFAILNQGVPQRRTAHAFQDAVCAALCE